MKKIIISTALVCSSTLWAGFDFGECSGSETFTQHIDAFGGDYEKAVTVGTIPKGIQGLEVKLISAADVDIRLYGENDDKIVHWPYGILKKYSEETKPYKNTNVTYSGYYGTDNERGHEFITVEGSTPTDMTMKAFGYQEGNATVNYSWTGKDGCEPDTNSGHFIQDIPSEDIVKVGEIPKDIKNLEISLKSDKDIDIQLYGEDGTAIIAYPNGLLNGAGKDTVTYKGMSIEWSGYKGTNGNKGHEYIKIVGKTTEKLTMKAYGYEAGPADVDYSWGVKKIKVASISDGIDHRGFDITHNVIMSDVSSTARTYAYSTVDITATVDVDYYNRPEAGYNDNQQPAFTFNPENSTITVPPETSSFNIYIRTIANPSVLSETYSIILGDVNATGTIELE